MIVPEFWAEGRVRGKVSGHQVTIRRCGWSDNSVHDAQRMADQRAQEAFDRVARGERLQRREPKVPYNGADGVPIREEIMRRYGDAVVTRNLYGALCLNTPSILFADIDYRYSPPWPLMLGFLVVLSAIPLAVGYTIRSPLFAIIGFLVAIPIALYTCRGLFRLFVAVTGGIEQRTLRRIRRYVNARPDWHARLYRTPAGMRLLAMHRLFDPKAQETTKCLNDLCTDRVYTRMCRKQSCFRARVSPKPWRIGINTHIRPRPGVWPIHPKWLPDRTKWIASYEHAAKSYASCEFIEAVGTGVTIPQTTEVQRIHDELSRANMQLPIA